MGNKNGLKCVKKNRHKLGAGHRNRSKRKLSVVERKRLKVLAQRLNKKPVTTFPDITIIEEV